MRPLRIFTMDRAVPVIEDRPLMNLASRADLQNLKVVVVSVAGPYCEGKRVILNLMLRYLRHTSEGQRGDWLVNNKELQNVYWTSTDDVKTEVLIWGEIFKIRSASGELVAVILMDTEDTFETESVAVKETTVLAFSVLNSSVQIYSLAHDVEQADLTHLELCTRFGLLAAKDNARRGVKPFQNLVFLIRDLQNNKDSSFGWKNADQLLKRALNVTGMALANRGLRANIRRCFEGVHSYIVPDLGVIADTPLMVVNGELYDIKAAFLGHLRSFIVTVLSPQNLITKRINGKEITLLDFCLYVQNYAKVVSGIAIPCPRTLFEAMVEANNYTVYKRTLELYIASMSELFPDADAFTPWPEFRRHCRKHLKAAEEYFRKAYKMGGTLVVKHLRYRTLKNLEYVHEDFLTGNQRAELVRKLRENRQREASLWTLLEEQMARKSVSGALLSELERIEDHSRTLQQVIDRLTQMIDTTQEGPMAKDESSLLLRVFAIDSDTTDASGNSSADRR